MGMNGGDLLVGAAIGAAGGMQGIQLPGVLLVGLGFDASVALAYKIDPNWFPNHAGITLTEVVTTAIGTTIGWYLTKNLSSRVNPKVIPYAAAGLSLLPIAGRMPGRMRHATYRWMK